MIRKVSKKRQKELREYSKLRKEFLKGKKCAVFPALNATDVHHKRGRVGYFLDTSSALASESALTYVCGVEMPTVDSSKLLGTTENDSPACSRRYRRRGDSEARMILFLLFR